MTNFIKASFSESTSWDEAVGITAWLAVFNAWCGLRGQGFDVEFEQAKHTVEASPFATEFSVSILETPQAKSFRQAVAEVHDLDKLAATSIFMKSIANQLIACKAKDLDAMPDHKC